MSQTQTEDRMLPPSQNRRSHRGRLRGERGEHLVAEGHKTQEWPSQQRKIQPQTPTVPWEKAALRQTKGRSPPSPPALAQVKGTGSLSAVQNESASDMHTSARNSVAGAEAGRGIGGKGILPPTCR